MDDFFEDELEFVYRNDGYVIGETNSGSSFKIKEIFMVAGEHSVIRLIDAVPEYIVIECYDKVFSIQLDDPTAEQINAIRDDVMVYDFCVEQLRAMPKSKALKSPLSSLKYEIECEFVSPTCDYSIPFQNYLTADQLQALLDRCYYLTNAYFAEWTGVITPDRIADFETEDQLSTYIGNHNLFDKGEGTDKSVEERVIVRNIADDPSYGTTLIDFARPYVNEVARLSDFHPKTLEEMKKMAYESKKLKKSSAVCKSLINAVERLQRKRFVCAYKPIQEKHCESKLERYENKIFKASVYGVFDLIRSK